MLKVVLVLLGMGAGAFISSMVIWGVGYQICDLIGVDGYEQPAYFTAFVLWPIYTLIGGVTGGATVFAIVPSKKRIDAAQTVDAPVRE